MEEIISEIFLDCAADVDRHDILLDNAAVGE
jgi:hypothetical protein